MCGVCVNVAACDHPRISHFSLVVLCVLQALWGPSDGSVVVSAGKCAPREKDGVLDKWNDSSSAQFGSVTVRFLRSKRVMFQLESPHADKFTECMWTNGSLIAWGGFGFTTIADVGSGAVIADFTFEQPARELSCFKLEQGWAVAIAMHKSILVLDLTSGRLISQWECEGFVHSIRNYNDGKRQMLLAGGMWEGLMVYDLCDTSALPVRLQAYAGDDLELDSEAGQKNALRSIWVADNGAIVAYSIGNVCIVRSFEGGEVSSDDFLYLEADDKVSSLWGSQDSRLMVTGHYHDCCILLWCLQSGRKLQRVDCGGSVKSVSGSGFLIGNPDIPLTIFVGCDKSPNTNGIIAWGVELTEDAQDRLREAATKVQLAQASFYGSSEAPPQDDGVSLKSAVSGLKTTSPGIRGSSRRLLSAGSFLEALSSSLDPEDIKVLVTAKLPTQKGVNCVEASKDGTYLFFGGREPNVSIFRLDTLRLCGPSLQMLQRSRSHISRDRDITLRCTLISMLEFLRKLRSAHACLIRRDPEADLENLCHSLGPLLLEGTLTGTSACI